MAINTTFVTEKNFDSPDLFSSLTKDSIADIFTDPNSDTVASMRERMHTDGLSLADALMAAIRESVVFEDDDVAKDWCRFVGAKDADQATVSYARQCLLEYGLSYYLLSDITDACAEVEASKAFKKSGLNKVTCRMLHDRITNSGYGSIPFSHNHGEAFTHNLRETELLYKKVMAYPWLGLYAGKYQLLQYQRFFGLPDISSTMEKLSADMKASKASGKNDWIARRLTIERCVPVFKCNEVLPPAKTVENALMYRALLHACFNINEYSHEADENSTTSVKDLSTFAYLYGDTNFSYTSIRERLNTSSEFKSFVENNARPSREFGLLDMGAIDRISAELGIDVKSAEDFLRSHLYAEEELRLEIPHDAEEAILRAMLQDAWEAWTHSGPILLDAYNLNLDERAKDGILMPSETALYEHWRPSTRVMKAVVASDTGSFSVFDLSGEALEKAFTKSLAHAYRAYAHCPGLPNHFNGTTVFSKWMDADYLPLAGDELNAMHERNQKLADAIVFPSNE